MNTSILHDLLMLCTCRCCRHRHPRIRYRIKVVSLWPFVSPAICPTPPLYVRMYACMYERIYVHMYVLCSISFISVSNRQLASRFTETTVPTLYPYACILHTKYIPMCTRQIRDSLMGQFARVTARTREFIHNLQTDGPLDRPLGTIIM